MLLLSQSTEEALKRCAQLFADYMGGYNQGQTHLCSVAVGQAFSKGTCDPELLVSQADNDMYRCKQKMKDKK